MVWENQNWASCYEAQRKWTFEWKVNDTIYTYHKQDGDGEYVLRMVQQLGLLAQVIIIANKIGEFRHSCLREVSQNLRIPGDEDFHRRRKL